MENESQESFQIRDARKKEMFRVDDAFYDNYASVCGPIASLVYVALCCFADKNQECYPSYNTLSKKLGISRRAVIDAVTILKEWKIITVSHQSDSRGGFSANLYVLTDKSQWKSKPPQEVEDLVNQDNQSSELPAPDKTQSNPPLTDNPSAGGLPPLVQEVHPKDIELEGKKREITEVISGEEKEKNPQQENKEKKVYKEEKQEKSNADINIAVSEVWDFYILTSKTKELFSPARRIKIKSRLKTFSVEEIKQAISNCFADSWYCGDNDRGWKATADYIFRTDEIVDRLKNLKPRKPKDEPGEYHINVAPHENVVKIVAADGTSKVYSDIAWEEEERKTGRLLQPPIEKTLIWWQEQVAKGATIDPGRKEWMKNMEEKCKYRKLVHEKWLRGDYDNI